ncbi:MAG: hypothetical protein JWR38_1974 [Mucilaginibacter sp.]|nr:hypothetical protein [Mucilaginibacter sp.]
MSLHQSLIVGEYYSKIDLSKVMREDNLTLVREGIYTSKNFNSILLFVDLVKKDKDERFHFNDYFQEDYFHWDSQPQQHFKTPTIQKIISGKVEVNLFVRIDQKVKSKTQPFKYCGRLEYIDFDRNTSKPIHLVFNSIDYDENNNELKNIYSWKPENIGKLTSNNTYKTSSTTKARIQTKPNLTERKGLITSRVGQGFYRQEILKEWGNCCAVTSLNLKEVLIASHIVPWGSSNDEERLDPENGILLSPNLDALFDKNLISFDDEGKILISKRLDIEHQTIMGVSDQMSLKHINNGMRKYLAIHRSKFNENN